MVIKDRREQVDVSKYRDNIQAIRNKIADDKEITYQTILLFVLDHLLEGVDKDKINGRLVFYIVSVRRRYRSIFIGIRFKHGELIKYAKNIDIETLRNLFLNIAQESGIEVRNCRNPKDGFDIYFVK